MRTHYQNLKVDKTAPESVIKAAFKVLSLMYHPDRVGYDQESQRRYKIICDSYAILMDPDARAKHDRQIDQHESLNSKKSRNYDSAYSDGPKVKPSRKYSYFIPHVMFVVFSATATWQFWIWSETGAIDEFVKSLAKGEIGIAVGGQASGASGSEKIENVGRTTFNLTTTQDSLLEESSSIEVGNSTLNLETAPLRDSEINSSTSSAELGILMDLFSKGLLSEEEFNEATALLENE